VDVRHSGSPALVPRVSLCGRAFVTFAVDPTASDPICQWLLTEHELDEAPIRLALDLFAPGERVLDVGAHIGTYSLAAAASGCDVIAVEGSPPNAALLREAAAANGFGRLRVANVAASDRRGSVSFVVNGPWGYIPKPGDAFASGRDIEVRAVRLGDLIEGVHWDHVDFMKMDIEGAELAALRGMRDVLCREDRPLLLIESNAPMLEYSGGSSRELLQFLAECGYELYLVDRHHGRRLVRVHPDDVQVECVVDYLACTSLPDDRLSDWTVVDAVGNDFLVGYFAIACASRHAGNRSYAARALTIAPSEVRRDPEVRLILDALALDADPGVRSEVEARATPEAANVQPAPANGKARAGRRVVETGPAPRRWPVFKTLARRDLVARYHRSVLGMAWAVLGPLLTVGALWAVLSRVFRTPDADVPYIVYLLSGITVLSLATQAVQQVGQCLVASESLRVKIRISPHVVALAGTASIVLYTSVLAGALFAVQLITGVGIPATAALVVPVLGLLLIASVGLGMLVASIAVRVHDALSALAVAVSIAGYATPTFYPIEVVPEPYRHLIELNPLTHFLVVLRAVAYKGELGPGSSWTVVAVATVASFTLGVLAFTRAAPFSVTRR
jgi:FkbM family methyltransferase